MNGKPVGDARIASRSPREKRSMIANAKPMSPLVITDPSMACGTLRSGCGISSRFGQLSVPT